jgi:hypothetical protein
MGFIDNFKNFISGKKSKSEINFEKLEELCASMLDGSNPNFNDSLVAQICASFKYVADNRGTTSPIKYKKSVEHYEWAEQGIQLLDYEYTRFNKKANKLLSSGLSAEHLVKARDSKAKVDKKNYEYNARIEPLYLNCTTIDIPTTPDNGRDAK